MRKLTSEKVRNTKSKKRAVTDFRTARTQDRIHILPSLQTTERADSGPRSGCKEGNFPIAEFCKIIPAKHPNSCRKWEPEWEPKVESEPEPEWEPEREPEWEPE